jgi:AbrB family looped-hinge helix DNA binding protein
MVLNSKGQVTIPAHLREKHGLHAGDVVDVVEQDGVLPRRDHEVAGGLAAP